MSNLNPLLYVDSYKIHHNRQYPEGMTKLYSNLTPRKSRMEGVNGVVTFGIQHFVLEYLIKQFNEEFFNLNGQRNKQIKDVVIMQYQRHCQVDTKHIEALWDLGYLPIEIKALDEGTICPIGVPMLTITNTHPDFGWLVNYLETLMSCMLWQPITSATIAYEYKKILEKYALETTGTTEGVQWQGHDFSMRGMSSVESAVLSGMGHLLSFTGTDTIPAIYQLEKSYRATGLIGASVPATEHSVMCMGTKESEIGTFKRLLNLYPTGILSVVSDTWDLWKVLTEYLPELKEEISSRDGKLVIRPDSGDPVDIICGYETPNSLDPSKPWNYGRTLSDLEPAAKGVIELLWEIFGGTTNEYGYKVLDGHIGAIYGDSITLDRAKSICERLKAKGFASTNIVFGIGSYTYQYNTRDTFGFAMKATYGEITHEVEVDLGRQGSGTGHKVEPREIFKAPVTDSGEKKSAKGLLKVVKREGEFALLQQVTKEEQLLEDNELKVVFRNSEMVNPVRFETIRERLKL